MTAGDVALFIDPFTSSFEQDRLFDPRGVAGAGDNALAPFVHTRDWLREQGVEVHTADLFDPAEPDGRRLNVFISLGLRQRYERLARRPDVVLSGFFAFECPVVLPDLYGDLHNLGRVFRRVFSYSTEEALRPFLRGQVDLTRFMLPQSYDDVHEEIWERRDRKFLVMINANKLTSIRHNELYTERLRAIEFFNRSGEIDLYGLGWDKPPLKLAGRIPRAVRQMERKVRAGWESVRAPSDPLRVAVRQSYRGPTSDKAATMGRYTFAICYENSMLEGWITEKLFDCLYAGTVPVYWGAPDIEQWIPPDCFIDMRRFEGYAELREFLHSLTADEIEGYRLAAREFLASERYRPFSKQTFAELIGRLVEQDAGVSL